MTDTLSRISENENKFFNKYVSCPISKLVLIESGLKKIFDEEINKYDSILLGYKPEVIHKLAEFLSGNINRSASIGIVGETASGKSTITYDVIDTIQSFADAFHIQNIITRVNSDDYYYDRSEEVKKAGGMSEFAKTYDFDVPEAIELDLLKKHVNELLAGNSVMLPKYDMSGTTIRIDNYSQAKPSKIIISEGLFVLTEKIRDVFDFKIYVDVNNDVQKERFYKRANERGLGESADTMYENASAKAEIYIRPCKKSADIIISGQANRNNYKLFVNRILSVAEQVYFSKI